MGLTVSSTWPCDEGRRVGVGVAVNHRVPSLDDLCVAGFYAPTRRHCKKIIKNLLIDFNFWNCFLIFKKLFLVFTVKNYYYPLSLPLISLKCARVLNWYVNICSAKCAVCLWISSSYFLLFHHFYCFLKSFTSIDLRRVNVKFNKKRWAMQCSYLAKRCCFFPYTAKSINPAADITFSFFALFSLIAK